MSFKRTLDQVCDTLKGGITDFMGAEIMSVFYETTPEAIEDFQGKILDHTLTEEDIDRVTIRLGDDIAKIYGFTLPDQIKGNRERSDAR